MFYILSFNIVFFKEKNSLIISNNLNKEIFII